ncbi:NUDIX domain-containing protein [Streptomyces sp. W16]|uniref:NUDIX domain-containing protein n=1 Tax=Streptomyces sp. W16 TaxID=3076631 RepID=UPI00295BB3B8|nr:NUDIX domain-containing protein [Streptomyces sp. W16]MDV9177418.1 NUDIX domain-containing protein [Streptomyces sp. W16]
MRELTLRVRVAAYVLRQRTGRPVELLVFDHDADLPPGTHVPAGGAAPEEPLEEAVLREVTEECGLTCRRCPGHHVAGARRDNGMTFHCRFEPLPLAFPLADGQDARLDRLET